MSSRNKQDAKLLFLFLKAGKIRSLRNFGQRLEQLIVGVETHNVILELFEGL
jgi:hypothetical protein